MKWPLLTEFQMLRLRSDGDDKGVVRDFKGLCEIDSNHG